MKNEAKFTKGPWYSNCYEIKSRECPIELATVTVFNEAKHNANLIAAAPEMYELLAKIEAGNGQPNCDEILDLLAKARGEK